MGVQLWANNAATTLGASLSNVATSLTLATGDGALFPAPTGGDWFVLTLCDAGESVFEVVTVTSRSGDVLTVTRAQEGSTGLAWASGDKAEIRVTSGTMAGLAQKSSTLAQFAATTSLELKTLLTDETGSGAAVFAQGPAFTTLSASGVATFSNATASTTTLNGCATFAGGIGVNGQVTAGVIAAVSGIFTSPTDASLSAEYITNVANRDFSGANNWTGTNWSISGGAFVHTIGANAATLANANLTAPPANGETYQITITVVTSAVGTLTIGFGGVTTIKPVGKVAGTATAYVANLTCTGAGSGLVITPDAAWVGSIDNISIKKVTPAAYTIRGIGGAGSVSLIIPNAGSVALGSNSLTYSVQDYCTGFGYQAGYTNTGTWSTFNGYNAGLYNTGNRATFVGFQAGNSNTGGSCTAVGAYALMGNYNTGGTAFGDSAGYLQTGPYVTACGTSALYTNTGSYSTAVGGNAGFNNSGNTIVAVGYNAMNGNTGSGGVAVGYNALSANTGINNTAVGSSAGYHATYHAQNNCTFLGYGATVASDSLTNSTAIGGGAVVTASNQMVLGNASVTVVTTAAAYHQPPLAFASLPAGAAGMRHFINNSVAAPAFLSAAAGGGSTTVPVFHDGTSWKVG